VTYRCPALQPELDISAGKNIEPHTREFAAATVSEEGHKALKAGAKVLGRAVLDVLLDPTLRERMWADYRKEIAAAQRQ